MTIKPFEIWIAGSGEVIGELKSGETAHRIAHMFLEECSLVKSCVGNGVVEAVGAAAARVRRPPRTGTLSRGFDPGCRGR